MLRFTGDTAQTVVDVVALTVTSSLHMLLSASQTETDTLSTQTAYYYETPGRVDFSITRLFSRCAAEAVNKKRRSSLSSVFCYCSSATDPILFRPNGPECDLHLLEV